MSSLSAAKGIIPADHHRFSDETVSLAFGRLAATGELVHIAQVQKGLACGCICPACEDRLVAQKGERVAPHFRHYGSQECKWAPESAAHEYGKAVIAEHKWLVLPTMTATFGNTTKTLQRGGKTKVQEVILEKHLGDFKPDLIVVRDGRSLLVEIYVTHKVDAEKRAKIEASGRMAIEIDLSKCRNDDPDFLKDQILSDAPREWLFHPAIQAAVSEMREAAMAKERAEIAARQRKVDELVAKVRAAKTDASQSEATKKKQEDDGLLLIESAGLEECVGVHIAGDWLYRVPRRRWQAKILTSIITEMHDQRDDHKQGHLDRIITVDTVVALMERSGFIDRNLLNSDFESFEGEISAVVKGYQPPQSIIKGYLDYLAKARVIDAVSWQQCWNIRRLSEVPRSKVWREKERHLKARERTEEHLREALGLERGAPVDGNGFSSAAWHDRHFSIIDMSPKEAIDRGDNAALSALWAHLDSLARMLRSPSRALESDLLGLPLEGRVAAEKQRRDEAEAQKAAREADARENSLVQCCRENFPTPREGLEWLDAGRIGGISLREISRSSPDELKKLLSAAGVEGRRRYHEIQKRSAALSARERLTEEANKAFKGNEAQSRLWLNSGQPSLGGKRPLVFCENEITLQRCLSLLPKIK